MLRHSRSFRLGAALILSLHALLTVAPVVAFGLSTIGAGLRAELWAELWRQLSQTRLLLNSLGLAALAAAGAALVGVPVGFAVARTDLPWRQGIALLSLLPLTLPPFLWATAWQRCLSLHGVSLAGLGGAAGVMALAWFPLVAWPAGLGFAHVDSSLEDDLRTLGGEWVVFRHGTLPAALPLLATGSVVVFILALGEFGVPALLQVSAYPVAVFTAFSAFYDAGRASVLCVPFLATAGLLVLALRRATREVDLAVLSQLSLPRRIHLGAWRWPAAALMVLGPGAAWVVPLVVLAWAADPAALAGEFRGPWLLSLLTALLAAVLLSGLGLTVGWLCRRGHVPGSQGWLALQVVLLVLPGTVVGLGLVELWNRPAGAWVYGTPGMILLGWLARLAPLLVLLFAAFLAQVPLECEEAVWLDGGGGWQTFTRLIVPLCRPALAVLGALAFIFCLGELATTILVAPPGVQTLAVRLFTVEANAPQHLTSSVALMLVATCLAPVALLAAGIARCSHAEQGSSTEV
ncbi:MAG: iron ABC transporter permease [Armatimonadetes bacterium]|nr:iron ABC transporter permease [Armatimonadota bacterium]